MLHFITFADRSVSIMAPLSAAERQRRCRARRVADTERKQKYLESERQRWRRDVEQGKKKISDLSERGKRQLRKKWRKQNKKRKEKAEARKHSQDTFPLSPDPVQQSKQQLGSSRSGLCAVRIINKWIHVENKKQAYH